jgi:flagellar biosynthesis GTPase FlhF
MAAEEQIRRQHEAQARYQQQQAAWRKHQEEEENRRRAAEQQAAEQRRRHEEAMRKQQQWASSQQQQQQQQWNQASGQQHHQQNAWNQQQQQRHYPQQQPQPNRNVPPPQQQQHHPHTAADEKYAKMANQSQDGGQAAITRIKHGLLIQWALQPPQLQMLRPIDGLITSIHQVFPPALGVKGHDYFSKWTPIAGSDLAGPSGLPDEEKLKKSVRKIRFFLHPDKLPNDLNEEQQFMTKMLWDVTSDAWEEYQKHREDLDWVKN